METPVYNTQGELLEKMDLPERIFRLEPSKGLLHEAVTAYQANQRRGTACAKTRSEVSGGGRKPWKQKHTGRARAGSNRSPLWRKGGVVFGPRPRSYYQRFPHAKGRLALAHALSARAAEGSIQLVENLDLPDAKTKTLVKILDNLKAPQRSLVILDQPDEKMARAGRNIPGLEVLLAAHLNPYQVLKAGRLILTKAALGRLNSHLNVL